MILAGKNVLITGGSSGIGQAIAIAFAEAGANVVFTYNKNKMGADYTLNCLKNYTTLKKYIQVDLSKIDLIDALVEETESYLGSIDILINNAGVVTRTNNFVDISLKELEYLMTVNVKAPFILMQKITRKMKEKDINGSILNISSMSATITSPGLAHYEASKAALNALSRAAASDLAIDNIRVNAIAPGLVETHMNKEQRQHKTELWNFRTSKIPLGHPGTPNDIARLAVFLSSEQANWITGTIVPVDGGLSVLSPFKQ